MKNSLRFLAICLIFIPFTLHAKEDAEIRVLFVGNSYTYYWNMPLAVTLMSKSLGNNIYTKQSTAGGLNLEQLWNGEKETQSRALIEQGDWDYVVFNNHSLSAQDIPKSFVEYSQKFADLAKQNGAKPIFFETWARKHNRLMQPVISDAYRNISELNKADLVPVGQVWMQSVSLHPEKNLYSRDDSHPSSLGSYLTALVFTKYFTGMSVQEVPDKLYIRDANNDKLYITMIEPEDGDFFRDLVDTFGLSVLDKEN